MKLCFKWILLTRIEMKNFINNKLDSIGFSASFICALHCAFLPILLTSISTSKLSFLSNPFFEITMILISVFIGITSLLPSYKEHKNLIPLASLFLGFIFIFMGHFVVGESLESIITPIGAFIVAFSHIINIKIYSVLHKDCLSH
ncbi:MAG: MerC domain-containing protein [Candidatus Sericytochromatia bacterium]